jgi:hypothetical protein
MILKIGKKKGENKGKEYKSWKDYNKLEKLYMNHNRHKFKKLPIKKKHKFHGN